MADFTHCVRCGEALPPRRPGRGRPRKYCSSKCYKRTGKKVGKRPDTPCSDCGELLYTSPWSAPPELRRCQPCRRIARDARRDLCSVCRAPMSRDSQRPAADGRICQSCRSKGLAGPKRPGTACIWCGTLFHNNPAKGQRFCSRSCYQRHRAGWSKSLEIVHVPPPPKPRRLHPSDLPPARRTDWWKLVISGPCRRCGENFTALAASVDTAAAFCSVQCGKAHNRDRRRAVKRGAYVADVYRKKIFERDGWRCQLCQRLVDRSKVVPHPRAPTLDHVIPLARGGTHEPSNCQLACFLCNAIKGDRGGGEQLRLIG